MLIINCADTDNHAPSVKSFKTVCVTKLRQVTQSYKLPGRKILHQVKLSGMAVVNPEVSAYLYEICRKKQTLNRTKKGKLAAWVPLTQKE